MRTVSFPRSWQCWPSGSPTIVGAVSMGSHHRWSLVLAAVGDHPNGVFRSTQASPKQPCSGLPCSQSRSGARTWRSLGGDPPCVEIQIRTRPGVAQGRESHSRNALAAPSTSRSTSSKQAQAAPSCPSSRTASARPAVQPAAAAVRGLGASVPAEPQDATKDNAAAAEPPMR